MKHHLSAIALAAAALLSAAPAARADREIYLRVAPASVAFVNGNGRVLGTGVLIDAVERLVVTANHVVNQPVAKGRDVRVFFPVLKDKRVVTEAAFYKNNQAKLLIPGTVIAYDYVRDLALVRLARIPEGVAAVPLAKEDPSPGDTVHVIGNSTEHWGGAFGYNKGYVRNSFHWAFVPRCFYALSHHSPTNHGDSGGPVVNDRGELVAVVSTGTDGDPNPAGWTKRQQVVDHSVHVREIRAMLANLKKPAYQFPGGPSFSITTTVNRSRADDLFFVQVQKGEKVKLDLAGKGATDLDLFADLCDEKHAVVAKTGTSDKEKATLTPDWTGVCRVRVLNLPKDLENKDSLTPVNGYTLTVQWTAANPGPVTVMRGIMEKATDEIKLYYEAGKGEARVALIGDGDTDLDLFVIGPDGQEVGKGVTLADREVVTWTPAVSGVYTVRVQNLGGVFNRYVLTTD